MNKYFLHNYLPLTAITIIVLLAACGKKEVCVEGKVVTYGTEEPIPDAKVWLYGEEVTGFGEPTFSTFIDTLFTDGSGVFATEIADQFTQYSIKKVKKEGFYDSSNERRFFKDEAQDIKFVLDPYAWLRITAENTDEIPGLGIDIWSNYFNNHSITEDYDVIHPVYGNRDIYINYFHPSIGSPVIRDTIYCPALDTMETHIEY